MESSLKTKGLDGQFIIRVVQNIWLKTGLISFWNDQELYLDNCKA